MRAENSIVVSWIGINTNYSLTSQIFGHIGHKSVLADYDDEIVRTKQEFIEIIPIHACPMLVGRDSRLDFGKRRLKCMVESPVIIQILAARLEIEVRLARGSMPFD